MAATGLKKLICVALLAGPVVLLAQADGSLEPIDAALEAVRAELIDVRRDLHRHPELSGEEERTAGIVAQRLSELGLEVRTGVGGHGVVAVLSGGRSGPVVGFRADMDAVLHPAPDPVPFASETPGVRHVCGHDIHTVVGLGIAEALASMRAQIPGTVVFVFQGAEETGTGARAMLAAGALDDPRPAAMFAVHTAPAPVGVMAVGVGQALPGRDLFQLTLSGEGDYEAASREIGELVASFTTIDIAAAAAGAPVEGDFVLAQILPPQPALEDGGRSVVGQFTTGSRESSREAEAALRHRLDTAELGGLEYDLLYQAEFLSGIYNDPALIETSSRVIRSVLGEAALVTSSGTLPFFSEDFGFFQAEAPGVMFWLGVSNPEKGTVGLPHSPGYVADEEAIFVGAKAMAAVLLDYLETHG